MPTATPAGNWPEEQPFFRTYAAKTLSARDGMARVSVPCAEQFSNPGGIMHGAFYTGAGFCGVEAAVATRLDADVVADAVEYKANLFRPMAPGDTATVSGRVIHRGRRFLVASAEVVDEQQRPVAVMLVTYRLHPASPPNSNHAAETSGTPSVAGPPDADQSGSRFFQTHGIRVQETSPGAARVIAPYDQRFSDLRGNLHPAFYAAVMDSAAAPTSATVTSPEERFTTIEYKVNLLQPIASGTVTVDARLVDRNASTIVLDIRLHDESGQISGMMLTTLAVLPAPKSDEAR